MKYALCIAENVSQFHKLFWFIPKFSCIIIIQVDISTIRTDYSKDDTIIENIRRIHSSCVRAKRDSARGERISFYPKIIPLVSICCDYRRTFGVREIPLVSSRISL